MKRFAMVLSVLAIMMSTASFAENGASLYKLKCSACHGKTGDGKMGPVIRGRTDIVDIVTKGGLKKSPHAKPIAGVTEEQAKAIAFFLK
jgi:mono/diheme cytochrome c family protein